MFLRLSLFGKYAHFMGFYFIYLFIIKPVFHTICFKNLLTLVKLFKCKSIPLGFKNYFAVENISKMQIFECNNNFRHWIYGTLYPRFIYLLSLLIGFTNKNVIYYIYNIEFYKKLYIYFKYLYIYNIYNINIYLYIYLIIYFLILSNIAH